ncbi:very short patch repair endonuclease [Paenibacillus sp. BK720]|uniref:very short patch repair endonuclease n=1 Tax=Paenibacillus sp. BK720 TaxID=2587092 RepID=UPI00326472CB
MFEVNKTDNRRKLMGKIKSKNTKLEQSVSKALWKYGFRFRKNVLSLYGRPDIAIKKYKLVIFIDSCFWHGCERHFKLPSKNSDYWKKKINRNVERDIEVTEYYMNNNWNLIRVWEHDLKVNFELIISQICVIILKAK